MTHMAKPHASFTELVERHRVELLAYARRLLGHEQDAQDVCQDALLRACRAFGRLSHDANGRAWLYKIVTNTALNAMRRRKSRTAPIADVGIDNLPSSAVLRSDRSGQLAVIGEAVYRLPAKQRAALMQRHFHGLEYAEIALSLGCSEESARANVYQAIKKLRATLGDCGERRPPSL